MLWGHKGALWPSYCGSRFRLTALGGQQVSVDFGYLRGRALKTSLLAPWNPLDWIHGLRSIKTALPYGSQSLQHITFGARDSRGRDHRAPGCFGGAPTSNPSAVGGLTPDTSARVVQIYATPRTTPTTPRRKGLVPQ